MIFCIFISSRINFCLNQKETERRGRNKKIKRGDGQRENGGHTDIRHETDTDSKRWETDREERGDRHGQYKMGDSQRGERRQTQTVKDGRQTEWREETDTDSKRWETDREERGDRHRQ